MLRSLLLGLLLLLLVAPPLWAADYEWRSFADDPDQVSLWRQGRQLGNYRFSTGEYYPLLAPGRWGDAGKPPHPPPVPVEPDGTLNFGLELGKMPSTGKHLLNGKEVTKEAILEALGTPQLLDDSKWLCLTIIGPDAARRQVLNDLRSAPPLAAWRDRIKVRDYPPDHWAVRDAGFKGNGRPTIYCQAADGKVLHRQDDYRGPEALAEVLRKADPGYRPENDPDLNKTQTNVPPVVWLAGAVLVFLLLKGDDK
jgi:hypothetical protein